MSIVIDSSVLVEALVGAGPTASWAEHLVAEHALCAPHHLPAETANILRRLEAAGHISSDVAALAHADRLQLRIELHPYAPFGERIRELRRNVVTYDGWYVAVAEALDVPMATLDTRLTRAPGPTCDFLTPSP